MKDAFSVFWKLALIILGVLTLGLFVIAYVIFKKSYARTRHGEEGELPDESWAKQHHERYIRGCVWARDVAGEEWTITSKDGLRLVGKYLPAEGEAVRNVLLAHGYRSSYFKDFGEIAKWHHEHGANILMITERGALESEGGYLTMGIRESEDIALWAARMDAYTLGELPMYLHGISMGCSSVLMAQQEQLPANVKGIIADCGFTSPWEISRDVCRKWYPWLPADIIGRIVDIYSRHLGHFGMKEKSTVDILKKAKIPTLFIHGMRDDFVPPHMTVRNYQVCAAPKRILMVEDATHALSWFYDNERYVKALEDFFEWTK